MKTKKKLANFRLDAQDQDYLYIVAEFFGVSKTDAIRIILRRFIRTDLRNGL